MRWTCAMLLAAILGACGQQTPADQQEALIAAGRALRAGRDPETALEPRLVVALRAWDADGRLRSAIRNVRSAPGATGDLSLLAEALESGDGEEVAAVLRR